MRSRSGGGGDKVINRQIDSRIKGMGFGSPYRSKVWDSGRLGLNEKPGSRIKRLEYND